MQPLEMSEGGSAPFRMWKIAVLFCCFGDEKALFLSVCAKPLEEVFMEKLTKSDCISLLQEKYRQLQEQDENRYPKRSDFTEREVIAVKAFLGPWPRALEAAGVKPPKSAKS